MIGLAPLNSVPFNTLHTPAIKRGLAAGASCAWGRGLPAARTARAGVPLGTHARHAGEMALDPGGRRSRTTGLIIGRADAMARGILHGVGPGVKCQASPRIVLDITQRLRQMTAFVYATKTRALRGWGAAWRRGVRVETLARIVRTDGVPIDIGVALRLDPGRTQARALDFWFKRGHRPVYVAPVPAAPGVPAPVPWPGGWHLVFDRADRADGHTHLVFRRRKPALRLPTLEFYTVANTAYVKRVSDDAPIQCQSLSIGGDRDSWSLRFSGQSFPSERDRLVQAGGPVEIEIGLNGVVFRALVKSVRPARQFGQDSLGFEAVSTSAVLAAPYAPLATRTNAEAAYAQALAAGELDGTGWALDWQMVDWLIPPGAYSLAQAAPIDAIKRLVEAAGGFLQTDRSATVLRALPRYAVPPWHWDATPPDVILPLEVLESLGSDWTEKPAYNGVYVSGQSHGVLAWVKRDGTDGAHLAPMVVDPLLTQVGANRARGEAILADTGPQESHAAALAVFPDIGILAPGQLVQVADAPAWKGLVTAFSVAAQWQGDGGLIIHQTATLERHYVG